MTARARSVVFAIAVLALAAPALAGPPLLCFPFDIGTARSLPVGTGGWHATDATYPVARVVDDTLAVLAAETPVIVRMETLRRATLYAAKDGAVAAMLLARLQQRTAAPSASPLAQFDYGYLVETYKQAVAALGPQFKLAGATDGYALVTKAAASLNDPQIDFALAVMTRGNTAQADRFRIHFARVVKAAPGDRLLQANLGAQFAGELR